MTRARFLDRVLITESCWLWLGTITAKGYGHVHTGGAHRRAFELWRGPIPAGFQLDHLCRVRRCVNPAHLEPVTNAQNQMRSQGTDLHCRRGHPRTVANVYRLSNGTRACRPCKAAAQREYRQRRAS